MSDYSFWALGESQISVSGGEQLDGVTQGDGSHLVGHTITLNSNSWEEIFVSDASTDTTFDDNDGNQRLDGAQTFDGVSYADNIRIEAEYEFVLQDPNTGLTYRVLAVNLNNSSPVYGTIEGLAFVDDFPPIGVELNVISAQEGPRGGSAVPDADIAAPPCFTPGTYIETQCGDVLVEALKPGDLVKTLHNGYQPLRWIACSEVSDHRLRSNPEFRPVKIRKDAFGPGMPYVDLWVSQQHRVLLQGWQAELMLGQSEVLVAAAHLVNDGSVVVDHTVTRVTYIHLQFDNHEVVVSNGLPSESFNPGPVAMSTIPEASRQEWAALFPDLDISQPHVLPTACVMAKKWEGVVLGAATLA